MKIKKLTKLLNIADLAIEHQKAQNATKEAQRRYHIAWQKYETGDDWRGDDEQFYVHPEERISRHHPEFQEACKATKAVYEEYKAKKSAEYNISRRLKTAIRNR